MKGLDLLKAATKKLEGVASAPAMNVAAEKPASAKPAVTPSAGKVVSIPRPPKREPKASKASVPKNEEVTQKKGITLRPANLATLDALELELRNKGVKATHSGLIQIAVARLKGGPQLEEEYRELLKQDLRLK